NSDGSASAFFPWSAKFNLEAKGANGQNVLHDICCASYYNTKIFMKLIQLGADPYGKDWNEDTPVMLACRQTEASEGRKLTRAEKNKFTAEINRNIIARNNK